jgi:replicative superfamily II helicase
MKDNKDFYYDYIKEKYGSVREIQEEMKKVVIECDKTNKNILVTAPTGVGKTFIAFYAIFYYVVQGYKAILSSPYKSLTSEQTEELVKLGLNVLIVDGDNNKNKAKIKTTDWDVLVTTYEMLESLIESRMYSSFIFSAKNMVKVIIIDEIHAVGNEERGANLESLIITKKRNYPDIKIIGLSATFPNYKNFGNWLKSEIIYRDESARPILLKKQFDIYKQNYDFLKNQYSKKMKLTNIISAYKEYNIINFCTSRETCEDLKLYFSGVFRDLKFDYHHAGLKKEIKKNIENKFKNGELNELFATTTLAQGVNLPADVVTVYDTTFFLYLTQSKEYIKDYELQQMIGRAGRPNLTKLKDENGKPYGLARIICSNDEYPTILNLVNNLSDIKSQIPLKAKQKFLSWMVSGVVKTEKDIENIAKYELFNNTMDDKSINDTLEWLKLNDFYTLINEKIIVLENGFKTMTKRIQPETTVYFKTVVEPYVNDNIDIMSSTEIFMLTLNCEEFLKNIVVREKDSYSIEGAIKLINEEQLKENNYDSRLLKGFAFCFHKYIKKKYNINFKISHTDEYIILHLTTSLINAAIYIIDNADYQAKGRQLIDLINAGTLDNKIASFLQIKGVGIKKAQKMKDKGITTLTEFAGIQENKYKK